MSQLRSSPELSPEEINNFLIVVLVKLGFTSIEINLTDVNNADGSDLIIEEIHNGHTFKISLKND